MSIVAVAKEAGVSHATVSYVLNGKDGVSSATAQRVHLAMRKLNYIPKSHMTKKSPNQYNLLNGLTHGCIGVVFYGADANIVNCPFYARLIHSIEEELRERDISMMLIRLSKERCQLNGSKIDGSIICGFETQLAHSIDSLFVSVCGHPDISEPLVADHIEPANGRIGVLAAEYFASRGHKKVTFFNPTYLPDGHPAVETRQRVFTHYAQKAGLDVETVHIKFSEFSEFSEFSDRTVNRRLKESYEVPALQEFIQQFAKRPNRPTGIFVPMDAYLVILQKGFAREGIQPGKDVEFIGCNNETRWLEGLDPRPATIDVNVEEMAKTAVERILHRIGQGGNGGTFVQIEVQPKLIEPGVGVRSNW